jgi:hypothetical protein
MNISRYLSNELLSDVNNTVGQPSINVYFITRRFVCDNVWRNVNNSFQTNKKNIQDNINNAYNVLDSL